MRKLLFSVSIHDCRVDTFCSGGKGGQHQNATQSGVRIVHEASGAVGECREERDQHTNKKRAFRRMTETQAFKQWHRLTTARLLGEKSIDERVEEEMCPENLRVEARNEEGRWVTWTEATAN